MQAIGRHLHAVGDPARDVAHERFGGFAAAVRHVVADHQLCVGIHRGPRPYVAKTKDALLVLGDVGFARVAERPNLIGLYPPDGQIAGRFIVEPLAGHAEVAQQLSTVMRATPVMRKVARRLLPSARQETIGAPSAVLSRFIIDNILARASNVNC